MVRPCYDRLGEFSPCLYILGQVRPVYCRLGLVSTC
jgi:hypothetical protein